MREEAKEVSRDETRKTPGRHAKESGLYAEETG